MSEAIHLENTTYNALALLGKLGEAQICCKGNLVIDRYFTDMTFYSKSLCASTHITGCNFFKDWILPNTWRCYINKINYDQEYHKSY